MIAVLWLEPLGVTHFTRYLESGTTGIWCLTHPAVGAFLMLIISAYIPFTKNAGMKLLSLTIFAFGIVLSFWTFFYFLVVRCSFIFLAVFSIGFGVRYAKLFSIEDSDHMRAELQP
jgi:hypothetical protein